MRYILLQIAGITLLCVAAFIFHPIVGLAGTGLMLTVLGISLEATPPKKRNTEG